MSCPSPALPVRIPRWPFPLLLILLLGGLWLLDTHQPASWPDTSTPWFEQVRAWWPASTAVDGINARAVLTPDLPFGSTLALVLTATALLGVLLAIEIPPALAVAVVLGVVATRSLWSTASPGHDALAVAVVAVTVLAVVKRPGKRLMVPAIAAGVVAAPAAVWLVLPVVARIAGARQMRWLTAAGLMAVALGTQAVLLRHLWVGIDCLASGQWMSALADVWLPGQSADASARLAMRQVLAVLTGDVHLFGLLVAVFGLARASDATRPLRAPTVSAAVAALLAIGTGLLPPALGAALFLPWWAPWFAHGLMTLVADATGRVRPLASAFIVLVALVTPLLRNAIVAPAPFVAGMPTVADAAAKMWTGTLIATDRADLSRRLRPLGAALLPAEPRALTQCVTGSRRVHAVGTTVSHVEYLGYRIVEQPLRAPLSAVLRDLRANQLVALALSPAATGLAGPAGLTVLRRLGLSRDALLGAPAVGLVARTDRGGDVRTGRGGIDLALQPGAIVGGDPLLAPLSVGARTDDVVIDSAPDRLAASRHAALVVYDRAHAIALRTVAEPAAGLPLPLMRHAYWRQVAVTGASTCVAGSREWTRVATPARRISLPTAAASRSRPVILYLGSSTRPTIGMSGLPVHPLWPAWSAESFDMRVAADASRLRARQDEDDLTPTHRLPSSWVTRITIAPRAAWDTHRVAISAGVAPDGWIVRLATDGRRAESTSICPMASPGDRLLQGHYGVLDDESVREIAVWATEGWHPAERLHGEVFQWTARPSATLSFSLDALRELTLAMDATGAGTSTGPQPVTVRLNDRVLRADWQGAGRLTLPQEALRVGDNVLSLDVARVVQPERDPRALGVLVKQLRIIGPERP